MSLVLTLPEGGNLTITSNVLDTMWAHAQHHPEATEGGGMLIGHHPEGTPSIILDRRTTPQPEDVRTRFRYHRDQAAHQALLTMEWTLSGHTRTYVGEWHTHPEPDPRPSPLDRQSWKAALLKTAFCGPGLVFIIVGTRRTRIWYGRKGKAKFPMLGELPTGVHDGIPKEVNKR